MSLPRVAGPSLGTVLRVSEPSGASGLLLTWGQVWSQGLGASALLPGASQSSWGRCTHGFNPPSPPGARWLGPVPGASSLEVGGGAPRPRVSSEELSVGRPSLPAPPAGPGLSTRVPLPRPRLGHTCRGSPRVAPAPALRLGVEVQARGCGQGLTLPGCEVLRERPDSGTSVSPHAPALSLTHHGPRDPWPGTGSRDGSLGAAVSGLQGLPRPLRDPPPLYLPPATPPHPLGLYPQVLWG